MPKNVCNCLHTPHWCVWSMAQTLVSKGKCGTTKEVWYSIAKSPYSLYFLQLLSQSHKWMEQKSWLFRRSQKNSSLNKLNSEPHRSFTVHPEHRPIKNMWNSNFVCSFSLLEQVSLKGESWAVFQLNSVSKTKWTRDETISTRFEKKTYNTTGIRGMMLQ